MSGINAGERLGKYELRALLGQGAMGTVHDAWDPVIARRVAIKTVPLPKPDDMDGQEGLARFKREAQAAGRLTHPHIVGVYDYGETETIAYIVMEFVDGRTLKGVLDAGERFAAPDAARVTAELLDGLAYSHVLGVVHRDIKPANIMLTVQGRVKIADFGIARIESSSLTQAGTIMGTPAYMSPEQFMGQVVDRRTDIYSTGVLLYQLLTGERPFEGSLTAIMHKALHTTPPRPSEIAVTSPPALDTVVAHAMARRPEDRYDTAEAFASDLQAALQRRANTGAPPPPLQDEDATVIGGLAVPPSAPPPTAAGAAPRVRPRVPSVALAAGATALVLAAVGTYLALPHNTPLAPAAQRAAPVAAHMAAPTSPSAAVEAARLREAIAPIGCASVSVVTTATGSLALRGVAGTGDAASRLADAAAAARLPVDRTALAETDARYCPILAAVAADGTADAPSLRQTGGARVLHNDETLRLSAKMPASGGYLTVVYVTHDGSATLLVPGGGYAAKRRQADEIVQLGEAGPGRAAWQVAPPFGTDVIVAIASNAAMFEHGLPSDAGTIDGLASALTAAHAAASVLVVTTAK